MSSDVPRVGSNASVDEVEAASDDLGEAAEPAARERLVTALRTLSDDLLAHLQFEEEQISGTLATWTRWPGW